MPEPPSPRGGGSLHGGVWLQLVGLGKPPTGRLCQPEHRCSPRLQAVPLAGAHMAPAVSRVSIQATHLHRS